MRERLRQVGLEDIASKIEEGTRLTLDDGVRLFECPDLLALGWLAMFLLVFLRRGAPQL